MPACNSPRHSFTSTPTMAWKQTVNACAAQWAAAAVKELREEHGQVVRHHGSLSFVCPYCSKTLSSITNWEHHVTMQPECHVQCLHKQNGHVSTHMKNRQRQNVPTNMAHVDATPLSKQLHSDFTGKGKGNDAQPAKQLQSGDMGTTECAPRQHPTQWSARQPSLIYLFLSRPLDCQF